MAFEAEIHLVVQDEVPEPRQLRAFWNARESDVLDHVAEDHRLWLGRTQAKTPEEPRFPGRAGSIFDLLYLRGTTPDYSAPLLTEHLIKEIMDVYAGGDDELPSA
ncbi:MAG: hypothetical protein P8Z68_12975, partial [Kineosporiaceae bacterium]